MDTSGFSEWLENERELKASSRMSTVSKCLKIESFEGDLDVMYDADQMEGLLSRLTYSADDKRAQRPVLHNIDFSGDPYANTRVLKSAARAYRDFKNATVSSPLFSELAVGDDLELLQRQLLWKGRFLEKYARPLWELYKDPVFKLVLKEVESRHSSFDVQEIKAAVRAVFVPANLEKRFEEVSAIAKGVTGAGYRRESAYYSIYFSMLVIDAEMALEGK